MSLRSFLLAAVVAVVIAAPLARAQADLGDNDTAPAINDSLPELPLPSNNTDADPATPPVPISPPSLATNATVPPNARLAPIRPPPALNGTRNATTPTQNGTRNDTTPAGPGQCARQCVRKEWRSLAAGERTAFLNAVRRLQQRTGTGASEYDTIVRLHMDAQQWAHGSDPFLPWHRAYLTTFERALQRIDPSVCVPYWNWALDSQAPENSPVFYADAFGGNGRADADNCVRDGAFAEYVPAYPQGTRCLQRQWNHGDRIGAFHSVEAVNRAIATLRNYSRFRAHVEGTLHPSPHVNIGGHMSQMHSPNDPIFWLHHAYIDYMWAQWQRRNGLAFSGNANERMPGLPAYRIADTMDHRALCYTYADVQDADLGDDRVVPPPPPPAAAPRPPASAPPKDKLPELVTILPLPSDEPDTTRYDAKDRANLVALRYPDAVPDDWCQRNNIPVAEVRTGETECRDVYRKLNAIKGYVSPCALWKRPTIVRPLVGKVPKFIVDVEGVGRIEVGYKPEVAQADAYEAVRNVRQRVEACTPDVERPAEEYRAQVQNLVGASAFDGAGSLKRVTGMDSVPTSGAAAAAPVASAALSAVAAIAVVAAWAV